MSRFDQSSTRRTPPFRASCCVSVSTCTVMTACGVRCGFAAAAQAGTATELADFQDVAFPPADWPGQPNTSGCQSIAPVSGCQVQVGRHSVPFKIRTPGYVISFTLRMSKPNPDQVNFF